MRTIGRWYIGETLGKGGYSWVKKGFDKKTGKCVALKFMAKADESWAKEQSKQVVTEIESLKQIRHPNVMKLYAYNLNARYPTNKGTKIDTVLLVLEFAPGGEIFDILYYTSALEPILARTYFRQSIFGLEACHNSGVAHRDIKPQNLLLDSRFNIKLTDFGLSKVFESDADAIMKTTYVGTRGYQAPELLLDKPYDLACDIFSMGVVLFILITGYPPFEQAHYSDRWFRPLAKGDYAKFWKYHAGCSISNDAKCKDLLEKMLCYDPTQRITIAQLKKHPWFNGKYLEGKELIRALRHRHREMEQKRRRDARKIKDLQVSITPNRSIGEPVVPTWGVPTTESTGGRVYAHYDPENVKEFFQLLSGLVGETYQGSADPHEDGLSTMTCTISKMEKLQSAQNSKSHQQDYKFEVSVYASRIFNDEEQLEQFKEIQIKNAQRIERMKNGQTDDAKEEQDSVQADESAHDNAKNKPIVLVVDTKRIEGDDLKFRKVQQRLYRDGVAVFNGLPETIVKKFDLETEYELNANGIVVNKDGKEVESKLESRITDLMEQDAQKEAEEDDEIDYDNIDWTEDQ
eukprot:CAMPEP_0201566354 /NCGR_PEP_ID=MMETSP0190_2-20130828/6085_1 /ASSEMBLY_ACC=CAM_ASM_000263 /TAXON_ID=37353 /ORGANISM="Rosalina sp." /LENGTH=573 /DNA_ID=CAMNT_0047984955 /DNA_START=195 /DNA_END=1916 /DNA_ORIENTATION=+